MKTRAHFVIKNDENLGPLFTVLNTL